LLHRGASDSIKFMRLQHFIDALERYAADQGVAVMRLPLGCGVLGRMHENRVILRNGLSKEQQLLTLIHELTHLLAHSNELERVNRTVCEYEAEAVERLVAGELGIGDPRRSHDPSSATDDLLGCSVVRVRRVARLLLAAARAAPVTGADRRRDPGNVR
jgi:hypothetical protein